MPKRQQKTTHSLQNIQVRKSKFGRTWQKWRPHGLRGYEEWSRCLGFNKYAVPCLKRQCSSRSTGVPLIFLDACSSICSCWKEIALFWKVLSVLGTSRDPVLWPSTVLVEDIC